MTTLGEITSKDGNRTEIHELESISRVVQEGKAKVNVKLSFTDIRNGQKSGKKTNHIFQIDFFLLKSAYLYKHVKFNPVGPDLN